MRFTSFILVPFLRSPEAGLLFVAHIPRWGIWAQYRVTPSRGTIPALGLRSLRYYPDSVFARALFRGMMARMSSRPETQPAEVGVTRLNAASVFATAIVVPTLSALVWFVASRREGLILDLVWWTVLVALVELLPAPAWRGVQVSLGFPLLTAVAITFTPGSAALVAFLGSSDPREIRRQIAPLIAIFNRCQVAIAVWAASAVIHALSGRASPVDETLSVLIPIALLASAADYAINIALVSILVSFLYRLPASSVIAQLSKGQEFLVSYLGLALLGTVLAKLNDIPGVGFWSVLTVLAPLLFARQMFLRSHALEEAHAELQEREEILRRLSNAMAQERADERLQIAAYLHDDLAQVLFRMSLQIDIARKLLERGELGQLGEHLDKLRDSKQETSDRVRALIRDLHRSPLGAKGLADSLESFTDEVGRDSGVTFHRDVDDIDLPAPIALLIFHIAREGVMNALKHASATDMWITVHEQEDDIVLRLADNGAGFDTSAPGPEGHFGMAMMRERAKVGGGSFDVESQPGKGTTITARFPIALLSLDQESDTGQASANDQASASPDTSGTTSPEDGDSRDSVPA
jgi:signal transduction histidine kinase